MTPCPFCAALSAPRRGTLRWCDPCGRWWGPYDVLEQRDRARAVAAAVVESEGAWQAVAEQLAAVLRQGWAPGEAPVTAALAAFDDLRGRVAA